MQGASKISVTLKGDTNTAMPDQKDKAQEKNRLERLQEEHGDADSKHSGGAGASGGNSGAGKSGGSKISATGTPDDVENLDANK